MEYYNEIDLVIDKQAFIQLNRFKRTPERPVVNSETIVNAAELPPVTNAGTRQRNARQGESSQRDQSGKLHTMELGETTILPPGDFKGFGVPTIKLTE